MYPHHSRRQILRAAMAESSRPADQVAARAVVIIRMSALWSAAALGAVGLC